MIDWETGGTGGMGDLFVVRIFEIGVRPSRGGSKKSTTWQSVG
ncbi:MAG: hypothetical protein QNJ18_11760 [Xenococcaceae cyanobacterium MO_167.B52]|nr:hypothetical protein [Xenococcaceae cyanobacterium MO_167.B52]